MDPGAVPIPEPSPPPSAASTTPESAPVSDAAAAAIAVERGVAAAVNVLPAADTSAAIEWRPAEPVWPPSGTMSRARANIAAIELVNQLDAENRYATAGEQHTLAQWSGWGAVPDIFDPRRDTMGDERTRLRELLTDSEWAQARRNTLNAHYTDPLVVQAMWGALESAGFEGGRVLEPGCGSGTFMAHAPSSAQMVGVELDSTTARIAAALHPQSQIRNEGFQHTHIPEGEFTAAIGNVPFGSRIRLLDRLHNQGQHSIHNHFIIKSLALTAPGGMVALLTSRFTMDSKDTRARREMLELGEFMGAVRLPSKAFSRVAGTDVVTDIVMFRRRDITAVNPRTEPLFDDFLYTNGVAVPGRGDASEPAVISRYFAVHPEQVAGEFRSAPGAHGEHTLRVEGAHDVEEVAAAVRDRLDRIVERARTNGTRLTARWHTTAAMPDDFARGLLRPEKNVESEYPIGMIRHDPQTDTFLRWTPKQSWEVVEARGKAQHQEWVKLLEIRDVANQVIEAQRLRKPEVERRELRHQLGACYDRYTGRYGPINRFKWNEPRPVTQAKHDKVLAMELAKWRRSEQVASDFPVPDHVVDELSAKAWVNPAGGGWKTYPHLGKLLRADPTFAIVRSLEDFSEEPEPSAASARAMATTTDTEGLKAAIFHTDVVRLTSLDRSVETIDDAIAATLDEGAAVDVPRIGELLGISKGEVERQLEGKAFRTPEDPQVWLPAARYLSGNIRTKLADVTELARTDPRYRSNVEHLTATLPARLTATQIRINPGVTWIPVDVYKQFVSETFRAPASHVQMSYTLGKWSLAIKESREWRSDQHDLTWGVVPKAYAGSSTFNFEHTGRDNRDIVNGGIRRSKVSGKHDYGVVELMNDLLNGRTPTINKAKEYADVSGGDAVHDAATRAAGNKARRLAVEFEQWALHTDPDRSEHLVDIYNQRFNSTVAPTYDGSHKTFPGLGPGFTPYDYQRNAVARICAEPTVLLDHVVGAGKTGTMLMGAMELRRLGLVNKPWLVVPNHLVDQIGREAKQWYPAARILSGGFATESSDGKEARTLFVAQSASQSWDLVICPMSVWKMIPVSAEVEQAFLRDKLRELEEFATATESLGLSTVEKDNSVKEIERAKQRLENQLASTLERIGRDEGLTFEASGCDYLFVDEAHNFKNLTRASAIEELRCGGSAQALDMLMKLDYLRQMRREEAAGAGIGESAYVERVATFATGTKVSNSMAEEWVMQTYLAPQLLADAGVADLNAWGKAFTTEVTRVELNSSGTKLRAKTRVAEYQNVGDLVALSSMFCDTVGRDQVPAKLPIVDDKVINWQPSQETVDFIADLGYRASEPPKDMRVDNSFKISTDGRDVSLSSELANLPRETNPPLRRAWQVAQEVLAIHHATKNNEYRTATDEPSPIRGALQIVFCDRAIPKANGSYSIYDEIRDELVAGGIAPATIKYIHDHPQAEQKAQLFAACREGRVSVLIGSSEKMGTGMNIQTRAIALHHADVGWRPADLVQRQGRIVRQGNQNGRVHELKYVAERTFDTIMWQTQHRKAHMWDQLARADRSLRSMPELGADAVADSAALTKAIATGDPRYIKQVELSGEVDDLQTEADTHFAEQRSAERDREKLRWQVPAAEERLAHLHAAITPLTAWANLDKDHFEMTVAERTYTDKAAAAQAFVEQLRVQGTLLKGKGHQYTETIASIGGYDVQISRPAVNDTLWMSVRGLPIPHKTLDFDALYDSDTVTRGDRSEQARAAYYGGYLRRLQNLAVSAPEAYDDARWNLDQDVARLHQLEASRSTDFPRARELHDKQAELDEVQRQIRDAETSPEALAAAAEHADRMQRAGREPGWTRYLNPTPQFIDDLHCTSADEVRDIALQRRRTAEAMWAIEQQLHPHQNQLDHLHELDAATHHDRARVIEHPPEPETQRHRPQL